MCRPQNSEYRHVLLDMAGLEDGQRLEADLCIIGAGAAGISLALQFIDQGLDVLLVESGGQRYEEDVQRMYAGSVANPKLHAPVDRFRRRQFGGSTVLWGGRCMPFDPIDFEQRSYVPHSGWPLTYDDLLPFYREANRICEAGAFAYTIGEAFDRPMKPMIEGFESTTFSTDHLERFSKPTNFAACYGDALAAANVRVLLHATATQFSFDDTGKTINEVRVRNLEGKTATVKARAFALATGGLEVPRLLLANRDVHANGIGNQNGLVGKYYMCHIGGTLGRIKINRNSAVWHDYDVADDATYCRRRFALEPEPQRQNEIGNFVARLHHPDIADPEHQAAILSLVYLGSLLLPWEYRTRAAGSVTLRQYGHHVLNVVSEPIAATRFAFKMLTGRFLASRKIPSLVVPLKSNLFSLDFLAEQMPNPDSRITLGNDTDALGLPQISLDWRYTRQDVETVKTAVRLLADDIQRCGLGTFAYDPDAVEDDMTRYGAYGGHHIGTARMGHDPKTSVVDPNCRVHGLSNLYIAGAAVFPTSSQANPTLTIVALALRLAGHLKEQLRPAAAVVHASPSAG